ncbi:unnamed protein product [Triticum turgidum subsp. durum]|uniref:Uncharacterized protein n=1 Tax=Triticum turgidum subsp. durum TaxID=4567 RepID=A0A9R0RN80_TRITD|nr:unnamed protein product [Triticum turgidum subsp. durum]
MPKAGVTGMGIGGATTAARAVIARRGAAVRMAVKWTTQGSLKDTIGWLVPSFNYCLVTVRLCSSVVYLWYFRSDELLMFLQTPAERVKAKMKLQLSETASKDSTLGTATVSWGRFEFNKDAPLDEDDNDVEVANDDATLVKHIGKSFRLSTVESKNENIVRDAHDEAMFGVPMSSNVDTETSEDELKTNGEGKKAEDVEAQPSSSLISDENETKFC